MSRLADKKKIEYISLKSVSWNLAEGVESDQNPTTSDLKLIQTRQK